MTEVFGPRMLPGCKYSPNSVGLKSGPEQVYFPGRYGQARFRRLKFVRLHKYAIWYVKEDPRIIIKCIGEKKVNRRIKQREEKTEVNQLHKIPSQILIRLPCTVIYIN